MPSMFWDAFLCHNGRDKPEVLALERDLATRGLHCWVDRNALRPGVAWRGFVSSEAQRIRSLLILLGAYGTSDAQDFEVEHLVPLMRGRGAPVVPVLLPSCPGGAPPPLTGVPDDTIFVDLRAVRDDELDKLVWAISGHHPYERESVAAYYDGLADVEVPEVATWLAARVARGHRNPSYAATTDLLADLFTDPADPTQLVVYDGTAVPKQAADRPRFEIWNKDHVWPKAFGYAEHRALMGDLHNLVPAIPDKNSRRGAGLFYDAFLDRDAPQREALVPHGEHDPRGIVARACLYMATRYRGVNGEPALEIVEAGSRVLRGEPRIASLRTLLYWHKICRVDAAARRRNDAIQALQGNRNPYVDLPELADKVFYAV